MKHSPPLIGLIQAVGLTLYVVLVALFIDQAEAFLSAIEPPLGIVFFLLLFVVSALISGTIILSYPLNLFFQNKKREAALVVIWSVLWLVFSLILVVVSLTVV